jgi:putative FmdB family regulatory protein
MPTYEYTCRACGHTFDIVQPMSDEPLTTCPECGGALRKVFGAPAISFKGSGFYATDHGKRSKQTSERSAEKAAASTETSGDSSDGHSKGEKAGKADKGGGSGDAGGAKESAKPAEKTPTGSGAGSGGKASS